MKNKMAIVATALMLGATMGTAQAQPMEDGEKGPKMHHGGGEFGKQDVRDGRMSPEEGAVKQVNRINTEANLDLSDDQKKELAGKMVEFQKAQVSLHEQYQQDTENLRETFDKELTSVLNDEQTASLKAFTEKQEAERQEKQKKMMEKFKKNFEKKRAEKLERGEFSQEEIDRFPARRIDK